MDDLRTILESLDIRHRNYVFARSQVDKPSEAYRNAKISKGTYYSWDEGTREYLEELANQLHSNLILKAALILESHVEEAAQVKAGGLKARDERIKQAAASEILDRVVGKPTTPFDVTSGGEVIKAVGFDIDKL